MNHQGYVKYYKSKDKQEKIRVFEIEIYLEHDLTALNANQTQRKILRNSIQYMAI